MHCKSIRCRRGHRAPGRQHPNPSGDLRDYLHVRHPGTVHITYFNYQPLSDPSRFFRTTQDNWPGSLHGCSDSELRNWAKLSYLFVTTVDNGKVECEACAALSQEVGAEVLSRVISLDDVVQDRYRLLDAMSWWHQSLKDESHAELVRKYFEGFADRLFAEYLRCPRVPAEKMLEYVSDLYVYDNLITKYSELFGDILKNWIEEVKKAGRWEGLTLAQTLRRLTTMGFVHANGFMREELTEFMTSFKFCDLSRSDIETLSKEELVAFYGYMNQMIFCEFYRDKISVDPVAKETVLTLINRLPNSTFESETLRMEMLISLDYRVRFICR